MSDTFTAIVLAGGIGTRMKSATPKHLHPLLGRRMVDWVIEAGRAAPSFAIADEDLDRSNETKTSAVHFLRFELTREAVTDLHAGVPLAFSVAHPHYRARTEVPAHVRDALIADLG